MATAERTIPNGTRVTIDALYPQRARTGRVVGACEIDRTHDYSATTARETLYAIQLDAGVYDAVGFTYISIMLAHPDCLTLTPEGA